MIFQGCTKRDILLVHGGNALRHMHCIDRAQRSAFLIDKTDNEILQLSETFKQRMLDDTTLRRLQLTNHSEVAGNTNCH